MGLACAIVVLPVLAYAVLNATMWHRGGVTAGGFAGAATGALPTGDTVNFKETLDYIWQLYLPRLPFMFKEFNYFPLTATWLNGTVGHFGWLDYTLPLWVYTVARWLFIALAVLAVSTLIGAACADPRAVAVAGLLRGDGRGVASRDRLRRHPLSGGPRRPLRAGALPVSAARALRPVHGARRPRSRSPLGAGSRGALVVLAMAHGLFAETLTISRYYG